MQRIAAVVGILAAAQAGWADAAPAAEKCGSAADGYNGGTTALYHCASALPHTGSDVLWLAMAALILLGVGLVIRDRVR